MQAVKEQPIKKFNFFLIFLQGLSWCPPTDQNAWGVWVRDCMNHDKQIHCNNWQMKINHVWKTLLHTALSGEPWCRHLLFPLLHVEGKDVYRILMPLPIMLQYIVVFPECQESTLIGCLIVGIVRFNWLSSQDTWNNLRNKFSWVFLHIKLGKWPKLLYSERGPTKPQNR